MVASLWILHVFSCKWDCVSPMVSKKTNWRKYHSWLSHNLLCKWVWQVNVCENVSNRCDVCGLTCFQFISTIYYNGSIHYYCMTRHTWNHYMVCILHGNIDQTLVIITWSAQFWDRLISLSCYYNRVWSMCSLYTHVTPIL